MIRTGAGRAAGRALGTFLVLGALGCGGGVERAVTPPAPPPKPEAVDKADPAKPEVAKPEKAPDKPNPIKSAKPVSSGIISTQARKRGPTK